MMGHTHLTRHMKESFHSVWHRLHRIRFWGLHFRKDGN